MGEPCAGKVAKQEKHGKEKLLASLKNIIKLVEEECSPDNSPKYHVPDCNNVKGIPCPPEAMVCFEAN